MEIVHGSFCIQLTAETQGLSSKVHIIGTTEPMRPGGTSAQTSRFISIAMIDVTKSRTGNYDFCACARARGFPGRTLFGRTHSDIRFAVCAERSLDNNLRFLRKFHPYGTH